MEKKIRPLRTCRQRRNACITLVGVLALCLVGCKASTGGSNSSSNGVAAGPCDPHNVANTPITTTRAMDISWANPSDPSACAIDHYNIVEIASDANGTPKQTVQQVPANGTSGTAPRLNLCTFYRFGVQAVSKNGRKSSVIAPHPVFLSGDADPYPPVVTIVLQGIGNSGKQDSFDPSSTDYCTSQNGTPPAWDRLTSLPFNWLNFSRNSDGTITTDPSTAGAGAGNNLIDSLARTGGYVLPFSYTGATVTGTATAPRFTIQQYSSVNVGNSTIQDEQQRLDTEIADVRTVWPKTTILVVGHSNGGLIAEQWWLNHRSNLHGVKQVFSLDSPLNGVFDGSYCSFHLCGTAVGPKLGDFYSALWVNQASNDPYWVSQDSQDKVFTAVGSYGDPLYDAGDNVPVDTSLLPHFQPGNKTRLGILS